jgi:hypothetical protein
LGKPNVRALFSDFKNKETRFSKLAGLMSQIKYNPKSIQGVVAQKVR